MAEGGKTVKRPLQNMSHGERELTPLPFARYLIERVLALVPAEKVAVLWIARRTKYVQLYRQCELWGRHKDAKTYKGPWPIVAHPPCGPWGKLKWRSRQDKEAGTVAIELVHLWGGVIEQPMGSTLFKEHGRGGQVEIVDQGDYGHRAEKRTLLYFALPRLTAPD
jgi:hypothetical protein